jgi:hypothetical protein
MTRYFLDLQQGGEIIEDAEGSLFASFDILKRVVLHEAREAMSWDAKDGHLDLRRSINARNEAGEIVYSLEFSDAVTIMGFHSPGGGLKRPGGH